MSEKDLQSKVYTGISMAENYVSMETNNVNSWRTDMRN